jgi:L-lactate dehydrogenase complex protein LldF
MSDTILRERIRAAITDESLQAALDANAARRVQGRVSALASLPDWRERRQRAHAIRADVVAQLDHYLEAFTARAAENGLVVHRAADAAEAVDLVMQIAGDAPKAASGSEGSRLFAKSKSMVSEEIGLNHALEARGQRVVETDLGEYIVQLRGEKPAHIITPSVHLRRRDVGKLFEEKLGLPFTDDIPTLTAAARRLLRQVFLTAEVGVSGVNFGVAETGALCIVTNEGNGRMVTTVPRLHIALMGLERLVPTLDDLALMLSLLARSATGQRLSVYTQLIRSPRRPDELDGAIQRHLILVDNGRSRIRNSPLRESLYCIRCGACLNACPVFREIGGHAYVGLDGSIAPYPGPIGSVVSPGLLGLRQFGQLAQASSLCGACKDACPVDIDLPRLLTGVRAGAQISPTGNAAVGLSRLSKVGLRAYAIIGSWPRLFEIAQAFAAVGARIASPFSTWMRLPASSGWGYSKDFPRPALTPLRARVGRRDFDSKMAGGTRVPFPSAHVSGEALGAENLGPLPPPSQTELTERFTRELEALGGVVHRTNTAELPGKIVGALRERGLDAVLAWDGIDPLDQGRLAAAGTRLVREADPNVRAGLTGAASAIAETGTLVITSGKGRPLSSSLLPEVHIAVLSGSQLVATMEDALRIPAVRQAAATVLITGPSRTADIEMTLTIGVHGPKELIVYIVE